jgi:hypothetical protein
LFYSGPRVSHKRSTSLWRSKAFIRVARYFKTKNPNLGKLWSVLQWKMLVYFMAIWSILHPLGILCGHFVYFVVIWYIFGIFFKFWYVAQ